MRIGVPRETKDREHRVGLTPSGARQLVASGHEVAVEAGAGEGSGFSDEDYRLAGARLGEAAAVWAETELVVKVKEPSPEEAARLGPHHTLFCYLHLASAPALTEALCASGCTAIGYETIRTPDGAFPVLAPMSEVAGRLAVQIGVGLLQKDRGGKGLLVGGVPGVARGRITVLGAGTVGINAVRVAHALGAEVDVLDVDLKRLTYLYDIFRGELNTLYSNPGNVQRSVESSDLVVGAVYVYGRRAPVLVTEGMVAAMEPGSVIVDVAVDQGGCVETIRVTSHSQPTYEVHGVIHYGVPNMPGTVPRTSTFALTNATFPYVQALADAGTEAAVAAASDLAQGVNVWRGSLVCEGVGESLGMPWSGLEEARAAVG